MSLATSTSILDDMSPTTLRRPPWRWPGDLLAARVAEAATTPARPRRLPRPVPPAARGRRPARPDRRGPPRDRRRGDPASSSPGADWAGHVPGQYLRIGIDVDGVRQWRAYSLTHGPRADGLISITVKAVPDGMVSNHLVHGAGPARSSTSSRPPASSCCPRRRRQAPLRHCRLRHHAGDRDAAQPVPAPPTRACCDSQRSADYDIVVVHVAPSRARLDLPPRPPGARRRGRDPARRAVRRRARPARRRPTSGTSCPTSRAHDVRLRSRRASSTPSRRTTTSAGLKLFTEQFRAAPLRRRRGRHGRVRPQRHRGRGRRRPRRSSTSPRPPAC